MLQICLTALYHMLVTKAFIIINFFIIISFFIINSLNNKKNLKSCQFSHWKLGST